MNEEKPKVIVRGRITYYIFTNSVLVDIAGWQFFSYNIYNNHNRQSLTNFKEAIMKSKETELTTGLEQMELAMAHKLISVGGKAPKEEWKQ